MPQRFESGRRRDASILLLLFALFLLASPFFFWWATPERSPWHLPYLIWGGIILLLYLARARRSHDA